MKAFVVLALVGAACAAPSYVLPYSGYSGTVVGLHAPVAPVTYASQYHAQDELGQVNYGFAHPGQAKNEIRDAFGNVAGTYTYIDADNNPVHVEYTAGVDGFQVRSNNLPVGPDAPAAAVLVGPKPVMDTPEVAAAKTEFFEAYNTAAAAAAEAADDEVVTEQPEEVTDAPVEVTDAPVEVTDAPVEVTEAPAETVVDPVEEEVVEEPVIEAAPEPVMDTPEVAQAKAEFQAAYEAAAAAAQAAPDFDLDGSISTYSGYLSAVDGALSPLYTNTLPYGAYGIHAPFVAPGHLVAPGPIVAPGPVFVPGSVAYHGLG
ncbi:Cuticle protein 6-like 2 [Homarus americanus]|uniref:Cuticle protein 6-like 2 n=1 Tax=Homarus americanus TaxID=6706 RepID=A0A8J5N466_HOMAM|nr:Cuticle protein 6-like 2 [Homarus americanus]